MPSPVTTPVFLIGYRGTGKTTVAKQLAARLGCGWIDADDEIERRAGKSIAEIFADQGQRAFRDLEAEVVADLCQRGQGTVIALGGGAVLRDETRAAIRAAGPVVWLTGTPETIAQRLTADPTTASRRPNLTNAGGMAEIETVLSERTPLYHACATFAVDTDGKSPADIVDEILAKLQTTPR